MNKEQILALFNQWWDEGDDIANDGPWEKDTMIQFAFAGYTAAIESYKAELLKEVGEPVTSQFQDREGNWRLFTDANHEHNTRDSMDWPIRDLFTSDQVAAAILKATKPLKEEVERLNKGWGDANFHGFKMAQEVEQLRTQLATVQEANEHWQRATAENENKWIEANDKLAKAEQLWQIAQGRCDGLEEKLTASQLRETQLRAALEGSGRLYCTMIGNELMSKPSMFERSEVCKFVRGWFREMQPTIIQKALALSRDTSALDAYVEQRVKEAAEKLHYRMKHCYSIDGMKAILDLDGMTRQRDLAVEAITRAIDMVGHPDNITYLQQTLDAIKESEAK